MSQPLLWKDIPPEGPDGDAKPLLLTALQAAEMFGAGLRTWRTWQATGRIPQPIRIGRKIYWRSDELRAWIAAGSPDRETCENVKE